MKTLTVNDGFDVEVIPSSSLVAMEIRRLAREQAKPVTITVGKVPPIKGEGRVMKMFGKTLLIVGGLYFGIHLLIFLVKP
jgi:hypothetical protein